MHSSDNAVSVAAGSALLFVNGDGCDDAVGIAARASILLLDWGCDDGVDFRGRDGGEGVHCDLEDDLEDGECCVSEEFESRWFPSYTHEMILVPFGLAQSKDRLSLVAKCVPIVIWAGCPMRQSKACPKP